MKKRLSYGKQCIDDDDIEAVASAMRGDWLTQGPTIEEFENNLADYCGAKHAIAMSSGTAALHIACKIANCYAYEGITSPISFIATANAMEYNRIKPIFVDIENRSWNIDLEQVNHYVSSKTRLFIPVHFAGLPCDMEYIDWLRKKHNLIVIEDACHAFGASYNDKKIGSCTYSDMAVFSFHPVKTICTMEGGAILTNNDEYAKRAKVLRNHGITKDGLMYDNSPWYYEMQDLGFNVRITDIQCALGISQLKKVDNFIKRRTEIAVKYREAFSGIYGVSMQQSGVNAEHAYHLFVLNFKYSIFDRKKIYMALRERGIDCQIHYIPICNQPYYKNKYNIINGQCPNAQRYYDGCLSIPLYPSLSDDDVDFVTSNIKGVLDECRNKG